MNTNINMSDKEYSDFVDTKSEKSNMPKNLFFAFLVGGIILMFGLSYIFLNNEKQNIESN